MKLVTARDATCSTGIDFRLGARGKRDNSAAESLLCLLCESEVDKLLALFDGLAVFYDMQRGCAGHCPTLGIKECDGLASIDHRVGRNVCLHRTNPRLS